MLNFWQTVAGREMTLKILEDNEATIKIVKQGYSSKLRSLSRTHRVNLGSIHEVIQQPDIFLEYIQTLLQAADIFTKALEPQKWEPALALLGMLNLPPKVRSEKT